MGHPGRPLLHPLLAAATIAGVFLWFAGDGIRAYFTPDDAMNLYAAVFRPVFESQRPAGTVVYRALFGAFGFDPLPFRIVCYLLLAGNLALLYAFGRRLSGSREAGALSCLLGAYHAHLADLYYSTGTLYDLLCCAFYLAAFTYYARQRERNAFAWWHGLVVLALYAVALGAKEMAVTLPVFLVLWEWLYGNRTAAAGWLRRWWVAGVCALATAVYVVGKFVGRNAAAGNPDYTPHFTWAALMATWRHYVSDLFYGTIHFETREVVVLWIVLFAVAIAVRRRAMWFALAFLLLAPLPVSFIVPRGFFAIYLSLPGWYLFAATGLIALRDAVLRAVRLPPAPAAAPRVALFLIVAGLLIPAHARRKPAGKGWVAEAHNAVRSVERGLASRPRLPRGARVLFLNDPYPEEDFILTFIFRLHYRDDEIRVDRARNMRKAPDRSAYDRVYWLENWRLELLTSR